MKKTEWSELEDHAILRGVAELGTRWCEITKAPNLTGRTDNAIKNRFYSLRRHTRARLVAGAQALAVAENSPGGDRETLAERQKERVVRLAARLACAEDDAARDALILGLAAALHAGNDGPDRISIGDQNSAGGRNGGDQNSEGGDDISGTARLSTAGVGGDGAACASWPAGDAAPIDLNSHHFSPPRIPNLSAADSNSTDVLSPTSSSVDTSSDLASPQSHALPSPQPEQAGAFGAQTVGSHAFGPHVFGPHMFGPQMSTLLGLRKLDSLTKFRTPATTADACDSNGQAVCSAGANAKASSPGKPEKVQRRSAAAPAFDGSPGATSAPRPKCAEIEAPTCAADADPPVLAAAPVAPATQKNPGSAGPTSPTWPASPPGPGRCAVSAETAGFASLKGRRAFRASLASLVLPHTPAERAGKRQRSPASFVSHKDGEAESPTARLSLDAGLSLDAVLSLVGAGCGGEAPEGTDEPLRAPSAVAILSRDRKSLSISSLLTADEQLRSPDQLPGDRSGSPNQLTREQLDLPDQIAGGALGSPDAIWPASPPETVRLAVFTDLFLDTPASPWPASMFPWAQQVAASAGSLPAAGTPPASSPTSTALAACWSPDRPQVGASAIAKRLRTA